ncbi:MAG TPA: NADH-quinone oxidoreductase subunit M [Polyangiaceae bacterium]|nr:NADH-quinone oxidoreductase subunit M [Polyangiaceae bacterium]
MNSLLSLVTFLPMIGAVVLIVFLRGEDAMAQRNAKLLALFTTTATFLLSLFVLSGFDPSDTGFQFVEERAWIGGLTYKMGVDGISVLFVMLTTFLMPITIWSTWGVTERVKEYMVAFLLLETLMLGVFCALDLVLFYIFFEGGLIPMFLIIGIWGGAQRIYAAFKFFLYTFLGSVLMLVAMIAMYYQAGTTDIPTLLTHPFPTETMRVMGFTIVGGAQTLMWLAFFASFAVKMPMWPVHTWLPDAHVQAPTGGSIILAAVLLKLGTYGYIRFCMGMIPGPAWEGAATLAGVAIMGGIIYGALVAWKQDDVKRLVAYSSVAHMGFVMLGLFAGNEAGVAGSILQMLNHGVSTGALFLLVGVIYDRRHTRLVREFGGLAKVMPVYAVVFVIVTMSSVGVPGTNGFVGEFMIVMGTFVSQVLGGNARVQAAGAAFGVVLAAVYMLSVTQKMFFGPLKNPKNFHLNDLNSRESVALAPLVALVFIIGFFPNLFLAPMSNGVSAVVERYIDGRKAYQDNKGSSVAAIQPRRGGPLERGYPEGPSAAPADKAQALNQPAAAAQEAP